MPAYNAELHIKEAIHSILTQTYSDFEFLIYNDGSTDKTHDIINTYHDERIIYKKIENNDGYLNLLNQGIAEAKGKYIARMDSDDIAYPNRFEEQVKYLEANPEVGICGSWTEFIGGLTGINKSPERFEEIQYSLFFGCSLTHPSVMMRNDLLRKYNLSYNQEYYYAEDHLFFAEASKHFRLVNIPKVLLKYRIHDLQIGSAKWKEQFNAKSKIQARLFNNTIVGHNEASLKWLTNLFSEISTPNNEWIKDIEIYKRKIIDGNKQLQIFPQEILERAVSTLFSLKLNKNLYNYYFQKYYNRKNYSPKLLVEFFKENYKPQFHFGKRLTVLFILKCLIGYRKKTLIRI